MLFSSLFLSSSCQTSFIFWYFIFYRLSIFLSIQGKKNNFSANPLQHQRAGTSPFGLIPPDIFHQQDGWRKRWGPISAEGQFCPMKK